MKKLFIFTLMMFSLCSLSYAQPWGQIFDAFGGMTFSITSVQNGTSLRMSVEWNQGDWDADGSQVGISTNKSSGWIWQDCPWFEDSGSDKRCRTDVAFNINGSNWYAFRFKKAGVNGDVYAYCAASGWADLGGSTLNGVVNDDHIVYVIPEGGLMGMLTAGLGWLSWRKR